MARSSKQGKQLPRIVIAGRPNTGKSTLFNCLAGRRIAITDPTPGVTRDPIEREILLDEKRVLLVDTGGFKLDKEGLDSLVTQKSLESLKNAFRIVFVVSVKGLTTEDMEFSKLLRPFSDKVILVVNKVDYPEKEAEAWNMASLGFTPIFPLSATHKREIGPLREELVKALPVKVDEEDLLEKEDEPEDPIKIAILGKPNTGKSSLANCLFKEDRSLVSEIAGTTRDIVQGEAYYMKSRLEIMDTAGIRKKKKVRENVEYYSVTRAISSIKSADIIWLMIDAQEGLSEQDKKIAALAVKEGKGLMLIINKWDLMQEVPNTKQAMRDKIRYFFPAVGFAPLLIISAKEKSGLEELINKSRAVYHQLKKRVDTAELNRLLKEWSIDNPFPVIKGKTYKIRYMTQVSADPLRFVLFVNRKKAFPQSYVRYIQNCLARDLGFSMVPMQIDLKEPAPNPYQKKIQ